MQPHPLSIVVHSAQHPSQALKTTYIIYPGHKSLQGRDMDSDHQLVVTPILLKLMKTTTIPRR